MRMLYMFKMKNQFTPRYLNDILPPQQGHYSEYSTRHRNNFIIPRTRTTKYHESFIPKSSREWNSMPEEIKSCECLATFKRLVKKKRFPTKTQYLSNGKGKHSINHARMRMGLSHLRQHLNSFGIIDSPFCEHCIGRMETTTHYLLTCPRYTDDRNEMIRVVGGIVGRHNINIDNNLIQIKNILLEGYNQMTQSENTAILNAVELFIENTTRFQRQ